VIKLRATAIILSIMDVGVRANLRKKDLSCDHQSSSGLKSGEYRDKQITLAPTASIIGTIDASLGAGKFSITTTASLQSIVKDLKTSQ
jgi:hypothetical protein